MVWKALIRGCLYCVPLLLREDAGLPELLGYEVPSPEAARKFLNQFHDEALVSEAQLAPRYTRASRPSFLNAPNPTPARAGI